MASGDVVGIITSITPSGGQSSEPAHPDIIEGGPANQKTLHQVWTFDAATDEFLDVQGILRGYAGGGVTLDLYWTAATTSNSVVWAGQWRSFEEDLDPIDGTVAFATAETVTTTSGTPSVAYELMYDAITFSNGAQMDSAGDGDAFVLRIYRDADNGSDNKTGDALLKHVVIREQ